MRAKLSTILLDAKRSIREGQTSYICYAINYSSKGTWSQKDYLKRWVMNMLSPFSTLEGWLLIQGRGDDFSGSYKEDRLAWLDWMIKELKKEGL